MKKTVVCMLIAAMTIGSMVTPVFADGEGDATHIYVLTAPEDHGWTGSVATFAKEKIEEVNDAGTYSAELITSADAAEQIVNIEDIIAAGEDNIAVVIQPIDDTVQSAIQQLVDAEIPYVAFDRIIEGVADSAVSNVKGDNEGIGAACAAYYTEQGLKPGDAVYVYEGDTSSVTTLRDEGFTKYLTGELEYDGKTIADDAKWSEDDLKSITYSGAMNWSRSDTKTAYESLLGDASNADIKWFYAEDDELAMGILEALQGGGIDDATKEKLLDLERRIIFYVVLIYDFAGNYVILFYIFSIQIINHILDCCLDHCRTVSYRYNTTKLICDICEGFTTKYCIKLIQSAAACQIRCISKEFFF